MGFVHKRKLIGGTAIRVLSKEQYDALSHEEKMADIAYIIPDFRPVIGADGTPIGTIINYMGTSAPPGYLVCDGSELDISDYGELALQIKLNFGAVNYHGGDGVTTFGLPDLRGLFLRGYGTENGGASSGAVGEKQEATSTQQAYGVPNGTLNVNLNVNERDCGIKNPDTAVGRIQYIMVQGGVYTLVDAGITPAEKAFYTSRPVNTAVLYCIKYTMREVA